MLPSIAASSSGHWNQDASRRWQRSTRPLPSSRSQTRTSPRKASARPRPSQVLPLASTAACQLAGRQALENLLDQRQALLDLADANPDPRIDVAGVQHRHLEGELVVGRIAGHAARVEGAARGAADITAGAELAHVVRLHDAGGHGAVLQRGGVVVELDQAREHAADFREQGVHLRRAVRRDVARDAARHDRVHHQPVTEAGLGRAQRALAQDAALRMHQRKRGVVADGADVAEMIGQPLQLGHQRAQIKRARRHLHLQRGFDGLREGKGIGDRAVAGGAAGELRRLVERGAGHQRFDALVHIAEPLLQPHDVFAIGGEAEMSRLDDAGMHRTDRDLMQAFAFRRQEGVGRGLAARAALAERMAHVPESEIEPAARVGRAVGVQAEQIADGAFEPDRRRMARADARIVAVLAGVAEHGDVV